MLTQSQYKNYELSNEYFDMLPEDQLEQLKVMEHMSEVGVEAWYTVKDIHGRSTGIKESTMLYDDDALYLLGYYDVRSRYGNIRRCKRSDMCLPYSYDGDIHPYVIDRPEQKKLDICSYCLEPLGPDHKYHIYGSCCRKCSGYLSAIVRDTAPIREFKDQEPIRKHYHELIIKRRNENLQNLYS